MPPRPCQFLDISPPEAAARLRDLRGFVFLDSATAEDDPCSGGASDAARFSLLAAEPRRVLRGSLADSQPIRAALDELRDVCSLAADPDTGLPQPGLIGAVDYDGAYIFGLYSELLVFDHREQLWFEWGEGTLSRRLRERQFPCSLPRPSEPLAFRSRIGEKSYVAMVRAAQAYIAAGDIYQVNLSRRFRATWPARADPFDLYLQLREQSPAPFAAFLDLGGRQILSSSPELFLRLSGRAAVTRPIKGTRPRFADRDRDEKSACDLVTSPKEIAELVMITDLERNDLGQICEFGSVRVPELLKLERFAQVFHLVSTVSGLLRQEVDHFETLRQCFPGGSITGAPKRRAREIITELEPVRRGLYTGAIGYLGAGRHPESQFSIAIRTAVVERGAVTFHSGAGIVADSVPAAEFRETEHKAAGILAAADAFSPRRGAPLTGRHPSN